MVFGVALENVARPDPDSVAARFRVLSRSLLHVPADGECVRSGLGCPRVTADREAGVSLPVDFSGVRYK